MSLVNKNKNHSKHYHAMGTSGRNSSVLGVIEEEVGGGSITHWQLQSLAHPR